jgi:hypothetical protein
MQRQSAGSQVDITTQIELLQMSTGNVTVAPFQPVTLDITV